MSAHDRFEILAGAVMLGEATPSERAAFDAHAQTCDRCCADAGDGAYVAAQILRASESERWRPSQPIVDRLRARRSTRARVTLGALGWSVALSLVLNLVFVSGIGAHIGSAFLVTRPSDSDVASTRLSLENPLPGRVPFQPGMPRGVRKPLARRLPLRHPHRATASTLAPHGARPIAAHEPTLDDIPDVLAGIDLYGDAATHRTVAAAPIPRCIARDGAGPSVRPCRDAAGRLER